LGKRTFPEKPHIPETKEREALFYIQIIHCEGKLKREGVLETF
jgi:hypothetical protein